MAGPFEAADFENLVPADKKLRPEWVESLVARGAPAVYRGADLEKIGMPVGGIGAGQVYLGGDGRLWHWDIFNQHVRTGAEHYARPMTPASPFDLGFAVRTRAGDKTEIRPLDRRGFADVAFRGEYPIGYVEYGDASAAAAVSLEAFSPFIPLNPEDSALPATVMRFTVRNPGGAEVTVDVGGWVENPVCLHSARTAPVERVNRAGDGGGLRWVECSARTPGTAAAETARPDILFEDFEKPTYEGWTATGTAFGSGPVEKDRMPAYQGDVGAAGRRLVNSHASAPGASVAQKDSAVGTLTSRPFAIERRFIRMLVGGGAHAGKTCVNLLVDDRVVRTATGRNDNRMAPCAWDVGDLAGKTARIQIVDQESGGWGNIGVDHIVFSDRPGDPVDLRNRADFGTMVLALVGPREADSAVAALAAGPMHEAVFAEATGPTEASAKAPGAPGGGLVRRMTLAPGASDTVTFLVTWHFPNLRLERLPPGRWYGGRWPSARAVAEYLASNFERLASETRLWHDTWYDSTLPHWLLDRTFANTSTLATGTCYWLGNGRFYGWEGVGCCPGTCAHVWHYAQAVARLFPSLERSVREMADFGVSFDPATGAIGFRGEFQKAPAADGQAGCILRAYREHQMSADDAFLRRNWERIRKALEYLIREDANDDGLLEGRQHNTLDTDWYGPVAWLSSLYLAALRAGEEMAREMGDEAFARRARAICETGARRLVEVCWNGEYFVHRPDPNHPEAMKSGNGCEVDQVFGQHWAWQVGLGRLFSEEHVRKALAALWRHNFTPDVGPYREVHKAGRWYAMPGEAGLLMCTWPHGDKKDTQGKAPDWAYGYFNECMNGFEYQAAGHMIWEGMLKEGLAVTRAVHDRYHPSRRNPWNEVECGDHYARSMASYGVFLAACGYEYHGPKGRLGFAPRLGSEDFRAAFTAAEGWGTFAQTRDKGRQTDRIEVKWGRLRVRTLALEVPEGAEAVKGTLTVAGRPVRAAVRQDGRRATLDLGESIAMEAGSALEATLAWR